YSTGSAVGRSAAWAPVPAARTAAEPKSRLLSFILDLQSRLLEPGFPLSVWLAPSKSGPPAPSCCPRGEQWRAVRLPEVTLSIRPAVATSVVCRHSLSKSLLHKSHENGALRGRS